MFVAGGDAMAAILRRHDPNPEPCSHAGILAAFRMRRRQSPLCVTCSMACLSCVHALLYLAPDSFNATDVVNDRSVWNCLAKFYAFPALLFALACGAAACEAGASGIGMSEKSSCPMALIVQVSASISDGRLCL
jgi:hypothetical protein